MGNVEPTVAIITFLVVILSLAVHEYAHAQLADSAGDPTPGAYGRVTLNPLAHLDPFGTILIAVLAFTGFGFGWAKPVPMDPRKMKNPKWDHFWAVLGGPLSNLILALLAAALLIAGFRLGFLVPTAESLPTLIVLKVITINVVLFVFNLLPIGPLDGMWILGTFLPEPARYKWTRWNLTTGQFVLLGFFMLSLIGVPIFSLILFPFVNAITGLLIPR